MAKQRRRKVNYLRIVRNIAMVVAILLTAYYLGPKPQFPFLTLELPQLPDVQHLDEFVQKKEASFPLKPGNNARIVWADTPGRVTEYAFVYLHGFTASQEEGNPIHKEIAARYHANLYLARLPEHGVIAELPMENYTIQNQWNGAIEALAIGQKLGKKVVLVGTSTGATLAMMLAEHFKSQVSDLVLLSPNIRLNDPFAYLLNNPWGKQIASLVLGGNYYQVPHPSDSTKAYWHTKYSINALVQLEELLEQSMVPHHWLKITQPTLILAYSKNEQEQDQVVSVPAMIDAYHGLGTPDKDKVFKALPTPADHVIGSKHKSKDLSAVRTEIFKFLDAHLQ